MKKTALISFLGLFALVALLPLHTAFAQTVNPLPGFIATSSPDDAITQRVANKQVKITGLTTGLCLTLSSHNILTTTSCGGGGSGSGTVSTTTALVSGQVDFSTGVATIGNSASFAWDNTANKLSFTYGSSTALSATTLCLGSDCRTAWPSGGGGTGLSTSTPIGSSNLLVYSTAGAGSAYGVATSSLTNGTGISFTGTAGALVGGTNLTITNTGVLSLAQTFGTAQTGALSLATSTLSFNGLTVGNSITNSGGAFTITPSWSGTLNNTGLTNSSISFSSSDSSLTVPASIALGSSGSFVLNLAHANTWTALQQFNGNASSSMLSANQAQIGATATTTLGTDGKITGNDIANSWLGRLSPTRSFALQTGTTTTMTGTTTGAYIPYVVAPFAGTLRTVRCKTDAGTLGVEPQINGVDAAPGYINASTTVGKTTFTSANTFSAGDKIAMINGTPASSPTTISCTFDTTETP